MRVSECAEKGERDFGRLVVGETSGGRTGGGARGVEGYEYC